MNYKKKKILSNYQFHDFSIIQFIQRIKIKKIIKKIREREREKQHQKTTRDKQFEISNRDENIYQIEWNRILEVARLRFRGISFRANY